MTVYLLVELLINKNILRQATVINVGTTVFATAEKCLRAREFDIKELRDKYSEVYIECQPKEIEKGK